MRRKALSVCALLCLIALLPAAIQARTLTTATPFDRKTYLGHWYQIALLPNRFQAQCAPGTTEADYSALPDGTLAVVNRCVQADGTVSIARAQARSHRQYADNPAILQVRFAPAWLSFLPWVWGDYWVIAVEQDYSAALVGAPGREYLWVLSRTRELEDSVYRRLLAIAAREGFAIERLRRE